MNGLVSIIIPVYNVQEYLEQCLESVVRQTYTNIEIILINDGSTDNSSVICDKYAKQDTRVIFISKDNQGVSSARNMGLMASAGDFVTFIDSDDFIEENYIELLLSQMTEQTDLVCCSLPANSKLIGKTLIKPHEMAQLFCEFGYTWGKLIRKNCIKTYFHPGMWYAEDFIFYIQLIGQLRSIKILAWNGYHYRIRLGSLSVKDKGEQHTKEEFLRKNTFALYYRENIQSIHKYDKRSKQLIKSHCYYVFCLLLLLLYRLSWQGISIDEGEQKTLLKLMQQNYMDFAKVTCFDNKKIKRFLFGSCLLFMPSLGTKLADLILE